MNSRGPGETLAKHTEVQNILFPEKFHLVVLLKGVPEELGSRSGEMSAMGERTMVEINDWRKSEGTMGQLCIYPV